MYPQVDANGAPIVYCARCIALNSIDPLFMVTYYRGTALCVRHFKDFARVEFKI